MDSNSMDITMDRNSGHSNMRSSWVLRSCECVYSSANCNMSSTFANFTVQFPCALFGNMFFAPLSLEDDMTYKYDFSHASLLHFSNSYIF